MSGSETTNNNKYFYVVGGTFKTKGNASDDGVEERVNKNGVTVFEKPYKALFGRIEGISIFDGDFGKIINIKLDENEDGQTPVLSFNVESGDGKDIMEKLPAVNFSEDVKIMPYRFTPEGESKEKSGISVYQKDADGKYTNKITNFFLVDKKPLHGYPTIEWDKASETDRKIFFIKRNEFLLNYFTENVIAKFSENQKTEAPLEYPEEDIKPEDIPFN